MACTQRLQLSSWILFTWLWLGGIVLSLNAQVQVEASITPNPVEVGRVATYSITVEGGNASDLEVPELPEGLRLAARGKSTSSGMTIINGRTSRSYTQAWQVMAEKEGDYTIPAQKIVVNQAPVETNAVELEVVTKIAGTASEMDPIFSIEVSKREFYLGEQVPITASIFTHQQLFLRRVGLIELPKDSFAVQRFPLQSEDEVTKLGGTLYRLNKYRSTLTGLQPGKYKLGPAKVELLYEANANLGFRGPFFGGGEPERRVISSNDIDVEVLPLPEEGKPAGFGGAVGDFKLRAEADPLRVKVGEPIVVEMQIVGEGNFDALLEPKLVRSKGWKVYPAKRFNSVDQNNPQRQVVGFSQMLVPLEVMTEIPAFEVDYFNPVQKKYLVARSAELPIEILPAELSVEEGQSNLPKADAAMLDDPKPLEMASRPTALQRDLLRYDLQPLKPLDNQPPLLQQKSYQRWVLGGGIFLSLLLLTKLGMIFRRRLSLKTTEEWRSVEQQLKSAKLSKSEWFSLAARYIELQNLQGAEIDGVLDEHYRYNFQQDRPSQDQVFTGEERKRYYQMLINAKGKAL